MSARAEIEIVANDSRLSSGLAAAANKMRTWSVAVARGTSDVMEAAFTKAGKAMSKFKPGEMLKGSLMHAGGDAIGRISSAFEEGAASAIDFERNLTRFQIAGEQTPDDIDRLRTSIRALSRETGVSSSKLLEGASGYIAITGDAAGAEAALTTFAHAAVATGAPMQAIAQTAASMRQNLKIDPKDFGRAISIVISQAKAGAVEITDLQEQFAGIAPGFQDFANAKSIGGLAEMGAALQFVRQNFGNAERAATGFNSMTTEISRHADKLAKAGVNVVDGAGKQRDFLEIMADIKKSSLMKRGANGKDPLLDAVGEEKAVRAIRAVVDNLEDVKRLKEQSLSSTALETDYMTYQASAAGKLDKSINALKESFAATFTPDRIAAFASALEGVGTVLGAIGSKVSEIYEKWDRMRGDPHENAVGDAAGMKGASAKETEYAAKEAERRAAALAPMANAGRDVSTGWFGRLSQAVSPGSQMLTAYSKEQDTQTELAGKLHRQAAVKFTAEAQGKTNRAAAIAAASGAAPGQVGAMPVIDYNAMGMAIARHLTEALKGIPQPTLKVGENQIANAGRAATATRMLIP